jgi:hypothetical protein
MHYTSVGLYEMIGYGDQLFFLASYVARLFLKDRGGDRRGGGGEWEHNKILSEEPNLCPTLKTPSKISE